MIKKIKLKAKVVLFSLSFLCFSQQSFADIPVIDPTSIANIIQLWISSQSQLAEVKKISSDINNWRNLTWKDSKQDLDLLASEMENANSLTTDVNHAISSFQNLYPGYESGITDFNSSFEKRNKALLSVLQSEIISADAAHAMNTQDVPIDLTSAAAIAKAQLTSMQEMNNLLTTEAQSEAAYRANNVQEKSDERLALKQFVGTYHKQSSYNTWVGAGADH